MKRKANEQLNLFNDKRQAAFGGTRLKSHPKIARTLSTKDPIHLVLRSEKARGVHSFSKVPKEAKEIFHKTASKHGVRIYKYANVGNHFHAVLRLGRRFKWKAFICELTSRLAALVNGPAKFWTGRPFTRLVIGWGRNFRMALHYVVLNQLEAAGVVSNREIRAFLGRPSG